MINGCVNFAVSPRFTFRTLRGPFWKAGKRVGVAMSWVSLVLGRRKFLTRTEVERFLATARGRARTAARRGRKVAVRDYFIVDLALSTGLRVREISQLSCGDILATDEMGYLLVRNGKGGRSRLVRLNGALKRHYGQYLHWKQTVGEPTGTDDPLLLSSNTGGHMSRRAIQKVFKRCAAAAGLPNHYSIHCLRHTYACHLYKAADYNLRLVQRQLGHARINTTEVYADVMSEDLRRAVERLYR